MSTLESPVLGFFFLLFLTAGSPYTVLIVMLICEDLELVGRLSSMSRDGEGRAEEVCAFCEPTTPRRPTNGAAARTPMPTELAAPRPARAGVTPDGTMAAAPAMAAATVKKVVSVGLARSIGGAATAGTAVATAGALTALIGAAMKREEASWSHDAMEPLSAEWRCGGKQCPQGFQQVVLLALLMP